MKSVSSIVLLLCVSLASGFLWFGSDEKDENSEEKSKTQLELNKTTIIDTFLTQANPNQVGRDEIELVYTPGPWTPLPWLTIENGHKDGLRRANISKNYPTKIIIPGFFQTCRSDFPRAISKAYMQRMRDTEEKYNIFCLNWKDYSGNIRISTFDFIKICAALETDVIYRTPMVAKSTTELIRFLMLHDAIESVSKIHLIGFGIGAHIAGMIGDNLKDGGNKVGRITALDPSSYGRGMDRVVDELFKEGYRNNPYRTVRRSDAHFVDVIHTDAWPTSFWDREKRFGTTEEMGHVDYFPNGGNKSPYVDINCKKEITSMYSMVKQFASEWYFCRGKYATEAACRHNLAFHFYAQSILDPSIIAYRAKSYKDFQSNNRFVDEATFGEHVNISDVTPGTYYLNITPKRIFKKVCFNDINYSSLSASSRTNVVTSGHNFEQTNTISKSEPEGHNGNGAVPNDAPIIPTCHTDKANMVTFWYNPGEWSDNYATPLHYNIKETFHHSKLKKEYPFKFLIHGFLENGRTDFASILTTAYRENMKNDSNPQHNIISVGWGALSANQRDINEQLYTEVVQVNLEIVATRVADFIIFLRNNDYVQDNLSNVHIIGHSLGAIIAGIVGNKLQEMTNQKVQRITGLDPAGPLIPKEYYLERKCAEFVDIVHTDMNTQSIDLPVFGEIGLGFGTNRQSGDIDYYPNGGEGGTFDFAKSLKTKLMHPFGTEQPCYWTVPGGFLLNQCAHSLSYKYYAKSINSTSKILAYQCPDYRSYQCCKYPFIGCSKDKNVTFGEYVDTSPEKIMYGKFYLTLDKDGKPYDDCKYIDCVPVIG